MNRDGLSIAATRPPGALDSFLWLFILSTNALGAPNAYQHMYIMRLWL